MKLFKRDKNVYICFVGKGYGKSEYEKIKLKHIRKKIIINDYVDLKIKYDKLNENYNKLLIDKGLESISYANDKLRVVKILEDYELCVLDLVGKFKLKKNKGCSCMDEYLKFIESRVGKYYKK